VVVVGGRRVDVDVEGPVTFGRGEECSVALPAEDLGISRLAGSVEDDGAVVWLTNRSGSRPLFVVDHLGMRSVLAPGRRLAVDRTLTVVVEGQLRRHALVVEASGEAAPLPLPVTPVGGLATEMGTLVAYTEDDRRALVALFAGFLREFPRHDPRPRSYADAAADLGWPRTTLVKRIEHMRERLTRAGVPGLLGDTALDALAVHVLTTKVITKEDLAILRRSPGSAGPGG
jgi:hypothetical protein